MTIRRGRPPARPRTAHRGPATATVLAAYLVIAFLVLAGVFALRPHQGPAPPAPTWDYQRETVALQGGGGLNAYARWAVRSIAWLTRGSIERQRDVHRLSPLDFLAGEASARSLAAWRERHRLPLEGATLAAVCALAAWGTLHRRPGRVWLVALLLLIGLTLLVTRPQTATRLAAQAGTKVPNLILRAGTAGDPSGTLAAGPGVAGDRRGPGTSPGRASPPAGSVAADPGAEAVQRTVAGRYWTAFVAEPLSRLQTGTTVLASAPPEAKAGVLGLLRARVAAVGNWAVGRRGPERAVIATLALAYVVPFALLLIALAMLASCAQALVWLLLLAAPLVAPLAVDPRRRHAVLRWWLVPLAAALALLAGSALGALVIIRVAELTHAADAYLGMLLAGSTAPVVAAALAVRRLVRRPRPSPSHPTRRGPKVIVVRGGAA
jgi:hypothetical protein